MGSLLKLVGIFIIVLLLAWVGFVFLVVMLKNKTGRKRKNIDNFKDRYKDLDDAIQRKKQEVRNKKGSTPF